MDEGGSVGNSDIIIHKGNSLDISKYVTFVP